MDATRFAKCIWIDECMASFNRTMRKLLADVKDAEAYVDDVIEHTVTRDAHIANLKSASGKIREAGLTILLSK